MPSQDWPLIGRKLYLELAGKFPNEPRRVRSILLIVQGEILRRRIGDQGRDADLLVNELTGEFGINGASAALAEALPHAKRAEKADRDKQKLRK